MFYALWVEHHDAAIVKVKGKGNPRIVLYAVPILRMLVDILKDNNRLVVTLLKQVVIVCFDGHNGQLHLLSIIDDACRTTACLQIIMKTHPVNNGLGL